MKEFDFIIVGAGIAGASLASELAAYASVLLIEMESYPGYHTTGRSAAFWVESYGGPAIKPLTTRSGLFLANPPREFSERPLMTPRGALHIGTGDDQNAADGLVKDFAGSGLLLEALDRSAISNHVPGIKAPWTLGLWEQDCCDIDVGGLHGAYLRKAKKNGTSLICNARFHEASRLSGWWRVTTSVGSFKAKTLINAAGAWADMVAQCSGIAPIGIKPYRRTVVQLRVEPQVPMDLPLVIALDGSFYFKPESGRLWLSPHDETPCAPCDVAAEEMDIATAIDRFQKVVDWQILQIEHKWAGLRSFAPDRLPVIGRDREIPDFFWFAGQGGFGIQTAPAASRLAASQLNCGLDGVWGIDPSTYLPDRLR